MKRRVLIILGGILVVGFLLARFWPKKEGKILPPWQFKQEGGVASPTSGLGMSFEESQWIAEEAVKNAPTYKFDGFDLKLEGFETLRCPSCWEFTFSFKSRAAGYGDRSGQMVAQVITPHTTRVTVDNGKVTSIVTDSTFDEMDRRFLK